MGLTLRPWDESERENWDSLLSEVETYNDVEIVPYLDGMYVDVERFVYCFVCVEVGLAPFIHADARLV